MTFSLRRKHPTTARGPRSPIRTAISLLVLALVFHARPAPAQDCSYGPPAAPCPPASARGPAALQFVQDSAPAVIPVAAQDKKGGKDEVPAKQEYQGLEFRNLRESPGLEVLSRLESEKSLFERMRQESLRGYERIVFPEEPTLAREP